MERVIVYGLGGEFEKNRGIIEANYDIVGYCDKDEDKIRKYKNVFKIEDLKSRRKEYDRVLITTFNCAGEICAELEDMGIGRSERVIFAYSKIAQNYWNIHRVLGVSYAEAWEDLIVDRAREQLKISYDTMKYIEIGVMDPIVSSNTFYFYERGACGILVEANTERIGIINEMRPKDYVLNKAVTPKEEGSQWFYVANRSGYSSLNKEHIEKSATEEGAGGIKKKILVETVTINEVFEMSGGQCDLLSMDIEGLDYAVLKSLRFEEYRPKIVVIELDTGDGIETGFQIVELLKAQGYLLYANNRANGVFVDAKIL